MTLGADIDDHSVGSNRSEKMAAKQRKKFRIRRVILTYATAHVKISLGLRYQDEFGFLNSHQNFFEPIVSICYDRNR